jgi:hypothetical protein
VITILLILVGLYVLSMSVFLISENRRPQAALAWLLVLFFAPGVGVLIYNLPQERHDANDYEPGPDDRIYNLLQVGFRVPPGPPVEILKAMPRFAFP